MNTMMRNELCAVRQMMIDYENGLGEEGGLATWATNVICELADVIQAIQNGVGLERRDPDEKAEETLAELREVFDYKILMKYLCFLQYIVKLSNDITFLKSSIEGLLSSK